MLKSFRHFGRVLKSLNMGERRLKVVQENHEKLDLLEVYEILFSSQVLDLRSSACLSANKSGEIWARGPQVMLGYHQNQQATSASLDNEGWLRTGKLNTHTHQVDLLRTALKDLPCEVIFFGGLVLI